MPHNPPPPDTPTPAAIPPAMLAEVLTKAGARHCTVDTIKEDIAAGAPVNPDGTLHLIHYLAWLIRETKHGA